MQLDVSGGKRVCAHAIQGIDSDRMNLASLVSPCHFKLFRSCCEVKFRSLVSYPLRHLGKMDGKTVSMIDIGVNLTDDMYSGIYNGNEKHEPDISAVLSRSWNAGIKKMIVTAGSLNEAERALQLCSKDGRLYTTIGVHPTRCNELRDGGVPYLDKMKALLNENTEKIVALGEMGLDYERTNFCEKETQKEWFEKQLKSLGGQRKLPVFLHCRDAAQDLVEIVTANSQCFNRAVVHSFDGSLTELQTFLDIGFYIGINGCSMKSEENCKNIAHIPLDRLMIETDAPWCSIRPTHFSHQFLKTKFPSSKRWNSEVMYKSRNEPQTLLNVLEVVAALKDIEIHELSEILYFNAQKFFFNV